MGRCGNSRGVGTWLCAFLALGAVSACGSHEASPVEGVVVFDDVLQLARGARRDSAQREFAAEAEAARAGAASLDELEHAAAPLHGSPRDSRDPELEHDDRPSS